ncbi:Imidazole glycerol phosphate synthase amidotransferase subunit [hydrothermal vent metagenome]|uniref:Imidazole glycerol phosphate synthase amidotransferase subunit n=1 Tax=hydrothermal vent metagenome TaxID=652676 RepID=A0A3B0YU48_9ZZZZ
MITILDYGLGNVLAFVNVYKRLNIPVNVARSKNDLVNTTKLILPGVGSFDNAMQQFEQSGMLLSIEKLVVNQGVPILGICVGMQMLARASDEGKLSGLGWIDGTVRKFDVTTMPVRTCLPHMGWNDVKPVVNGGLFQDIEQDARFYFLHSYYFECNQQKNIMAETDYGGAFSSAVFNDHVYGVQFHPEKSHHYGSQLLKNFSEI